MCPVNRSSTVADSSGSVWSGRSDTLRKTRNYLEQAYGVRILRRSPCPYRNCRTKRKASQRPYIKIYQVGYTWVSQGRAHIGCSSRRTTYLRRWSWKLCTGTPQLGAVGISWELSTVCRPQVCSTDTEGHKPGQILAGIQMTLKHHWTSQGRNLHFTSYKILPELTC